MKIVKIGEYYALRRWDWFWLSYRYLDLCHLNYWWGKNCTYFHDCLTLDKNHKQFLRARKESTV